MVHTEQFQTYLSRLEEARLYFEQGLKESAIELFEEIFNEVQGSELPQSEKEDLGLRIQSDLKWMKEESEASNTSHESDKDDIALDAISPEQAFEYGTALMNGQFWERAIKKFKQAAAIGYRTMDCWELCGDCAFNLQMLEESIRYYEIVYTDPTVPEHLKQKILQKITRCSQTLRNNEVRSFLNAKSTSSKARGATSETRTGGQADGHPVVSGRSVDQASIHQLFGKLIHSWSNDKGKCLAEKPAAYRILNLIHVGATSMIVELEAEEDGRRLVGQGINAPFNGHLSPKSLANWAHAHLMSDSVYLTKVYDLAHLDDFFLIVREYLPLSLVDLLSAEDLMPIPIAVFIAYRILEGLGDLHLYMGHDEQIRKRHHLDLRPSRVLLHDQKPVVKIYNGGLWSVLEESNPRATAIQRLPLPFLPYRAPEQFRPYLARRKPPLFTDIYLFGTLFYEMLTGNLAFRASSFEEYEIQHCEQYPTSPRTWRPEIPKELNDIIMKCLERDPIKRWRSTTQLSLILEKSFNQYIQTPAKDGSLRRYLQGIRPL